MAYNNPNQQNQFYGLPETNRHFKPSNLYPKVQIYQKHAKTPHQTTPTGTPHRNSILNCNQQSTPPTPDRKQVKICNTLSTPPTPLQFSTKNDCNQYWLPTALLTSNANVKK